MIPSLREFVAAIEEANLSLSEKQIKKAAEFAVILHRENQNQNLTRILGVREFVQGHLKDVVEFLSLPAVGLKIMDIGSGSGVPGLLGACIDLNPERLWQLVESEIGKAEYLSAAIAELGLENVAVLHGRAEQEIAESDPDTVTARAVGSVEKISAWIWNCSTWNNLILFKSRGWDEEWKIAQQSRFGKKLTITHTHDYSNSEQTRYLISLSRSKK